MAFRYATGDLVRAGDSIIFQDGRARVLFVKQAGEADSFAAGVVPSNWEFMPGDIVFLEFEGGRQVGYSTFCDHDEATLISREPAA